MKGEPGSPGLALRPAALCPPVSALLGTHCSMCQALSRMKRLLLRRARLSPSGGAWWVEKLRGRGSGEAWGQNPVWLCQQLPLDPGEGPWTSGNPDRVHRSSRAHRQR